MHKLTKPLINYHRSNHELARQVVYTQGRTPEETCADVLQAIDPTVSDIILIGPMGAGKSTIGKLLAETLGVPQVSMDRIRWDYYKEIGFDEETQRTIAEAEGFAGIYRYWKPFEIYAVERLLAEHHHREGNCPMTGQCIIDFGAGHSVYDDDAMLGRARIALAPFANVVLLIPSPDPDESIRELRERANQQSTINGLDLQRFFLTHPSPRQLATRVVYTADKSPEEIAGEIVAGSSE